MFLPKLHAHMQHSPINSTPPLRIQFGLNQLNFLLRSNSQVYSGGGFKKEGGDEPQEETGK